MSQTKNILTDQALEIIVARAFEGSKIKNHHELKEGFCNAAYKIELENGKRVVLKIAPANASCLMSCELNCFLNESMYYIEQRDFEDLSGKQIFEKMKNMQSSLLSCITKHYLLSPDEEKILKDYNRVIFSSFFPNVYLMVKLIEKGVFIDKIEDFLDELLHY